MEYVKIKWVLNARGWEERCGVRAGHPAPWGTAAAVPPTVLHRGASAHPSLSQKWVAIFSWVLTYRCRRVRPREARPQGPRRPPWEHTSYSPPLLRHIYACLRGGHRDGSDTACPVAGRADTQHGSLGTASSALTVRGSSPAAPLGLSRPRGSLRKCQGEGLNCPVEATWSEAPCRGLANHIW